MLLCKFCSKECKNSNSLKNHESRCRSNPDRKVTAVGNRAGSTPWNKGLQGDSRLKHSDESRKLMSEKRRQRPDGWDDGNAEKISKTITEKVGRGEWHTSLAKHMHIDYNGVDLHGSWELKYAQFLDANSISWVRNKDSFSYEFEGKERKYTPDFYLPETDEYIEIKGYKTEKDAAKWDQFPKHRKLVVLMKKELNNLGIKTE